MTPPNQLPIALVSREEAARICGTSVSTFEAMVAKGEAPKPRQFGRRGAKWFVPGLFAWAEKLPEANNLPPPPKKGDAA